jgi:hypothetical protein
MGDVARPLPEESQSGTAVFEEESGMKGIMRLVLVGVVAALAAGASSGRAEAGLLSCGTTGLQPFAPWGDYSPYTLAPNGSFDAGTAGWSLSGGARLVDDGNPYASTSKSLFLPAGASATSPAACVKIADPAFRFFLRNAGSTNTGNLKVEITYKTLLGLLPMTATLGTITADGKWQPSPKYGTVLANILGTLGLNKNLSASLRFKFTARNGSFQIDDLFVDPIIQF